MRIIAGKYRSRLIEMPKGVKVRPTQDRVREAIFSILGTACTDSSILDLYSGSGAFGIEALSRGGKEAVFVDSNTKCASTIKANLARLKIKDNVTILRLDAIKSIKKLARNKRYFELVFLDPPYYKGLVEKTLIALDEYAIIRTSGFAIAEHSGKDKVPEVISNLKLVRQSAYGDTIVSFYKTLQDKRLGD